MEVKNILANYYQDYDEEGRLLSRVGKVEYLTTMRYVDKYLRPGMRAMEIGAATGRYSHALARRGFQVDAVELVEHNIEIFRQNTQPGERVTITQGNACDLSAFADDTYDVTLLLGPMYHLFTEKDKLQALSEAMRVTKKGGVIFAAYCMADPCIMSYGFRKGNIHSLIERGMVETEHFKAFSNPQELFELHRTEDIAVLRSHFDVQPLHFLAADGYVPHMRDTLEAMDDQTYEVYLKYHFATCERMDLIGYSNHTLDVFRKR